MCMQATSHFLKLSHSHSHCHSFYSSSLITQGEPLKDLAAAEARRLRFNPQELADKLWNDVNIVHGVFGSACYIESSWCVLCG